MFRFATSFPAEQIPKKETSANLSDLKQSTVQTKIPALTGI
jgi:hypothetical protein